MRKEGIAVHRTIFPEVIPLVLFRKPARHHLSIRIGIIRFTAKLEKGTTVHAAPAPEIIIRTIDFLPAGYHLSISPF